MLDSFKIQFLKDNIKMIISYWNFMIDQNCTNPND